MLPLQEKLWVAHTHKQSKYDYLEVSSEKGPYSKSSWPEGCDYIRMQLKCTEQEIILNTQLGLKGHIG